MKLKEKYKKRIKEIKKLIPFFYEDLKIDPFIDFIQK
jgi:DNA-directed RNA polymerase delta subunit